MTTTRELFASSFENLTYRQITNLTMNREKRKELESRLKRLEGFIGAADALAQDIRVHLSLGQLNERDDGI